MRSTCLLMAALGLAGCGDKPVTLEEYQTQVVTLPDGAKIRAEVMTHPTDMMRGMMFRDSLPEDRGMLFIHGSPGPYPYWMYQVKIPLDIIWMSSEQRIVEITTTLAETKVGDKSLLHDKVRGCILAGAIGNAMGSPVEGKFYYEIDARYPDHITTILDPSRLEGEDDNQMAMLLVETYIERGGLPVMARHFGRTWHERLNRDHFYPLCMGNAYDLIRAGQDPRITGHWSVVTGSTVMCMEPVGLYHLGDGEFAAIDARAISYLYQRGLDVSAACMLATISRMSLTRPIAR
jgi:hypothetical protein